MFRCYDWLTGKELRVESLCLIEKSGVRGAEPGLRSEPLQVRPEAPQPESRGCSTGSPTEGRNRLLRTDSLGALTTDHVLENFFLLTVTY